MKKYVVCVLFTLLGASTLFAQQKIDTILPIRGLAIAAPSKARVGEFVQFIETELAPAHFNKLILRVDYNYAYTSHPELRDKNPLSEADIKQIVRVCKKHGIDIAPQINLLGHQSWAFSTSSLLRVYPQFDETPHVKMDADRAGEEWAWPNADGLYCKSYCPLHPDVHTIVFALMDELIDVFEATSFHAGLDEVFYLAHDKCPRCAGRNKAELFANEVNKIRDHLALKDRRLLMWGDRLLDGEATGLGEWEASENDTHQAIDLLAKDIQIYDWHYNAASLTPVLLAMKGFDVVSCPWNKWEVAEQQIADMQRFRKESPIAIADRYKGLMYTVWSPADNFLDRYYDEEHAKEDVSDAKTLRYIIAKFKELNK